jgi:hypothetical protein
MPSFPRFFSSVEIEKVARAGVIVAHIALWFVYAQLKATS